MRKSFNIFFTAAVLFAGLCGCKEEEQPMESVDLRYRVADSYNLPASNANPFTIVVTSTAPWTITSMHPDWCIIDIEEGEASDPDMVLVGKGDKTTVRVQYYDNTDLDDRVDQLEIKSGYWTGKVVTIYQKGIAYLSVPEEELNIDVEKMGGEIPVHIIANQDWHVQITDGEWLGISEGSSGTGDGVVTLIAQDNPQEKRYAALTVFDRHGEPQVVVNFTQDGVQLDPATFELRAGYDQHETTLDVVANAKWTAVKDNDNDTWYTITNPDNVGDGTLNITLTTNEGTGLRVGHIIIRSVSENPDDFVAEKVITVKQAYRIEPVRVEFDNDEMGKWESDKGIAPVYTKGVGTLFTGGSAQYSRLHNGEMAFGTYTFRWSNIAPDARVRHWFCYSDGQEIKFNLVAADKNVVMDFNGSSSGVSGKPEGLSSYDVDPSVPHEMTVKFDPAGTEFCHVTYLVDGVEIGSFDSSATVMHKVLWGAEVNMYVGVDTGGSAVCEWYEYTAPVNWDE